MPLPPLATTFPNAPLVDSGGNATLPWRTFLLALWRRTGTTAGIDAGTAGTQIAAETAARAAEDGVLSNAISGEATARTAAIAAEAAVRAAADAALLTRGADDWATHNWSGLPTADPGGGRPWLLDGYVVVGGIMLELEDESGRWELEDGTGAWGVG